MWWFCVDEVRDRFKDDDTAMSFGLHSQHAVSLGEQMRKHGLGFSFDARERNHDSVC